MRRAIRRAARVVKQPTAFQLSANELHERKVFALITECCYRCDRKLINGVCPEPVLCAAEWIAMFPEAAVAS